MGTLLVLLIWYLHTVITVSTAPNQDVFFACLISFCVTTCTHPKLYPHPSLHQHLYYLGEQRLLGNGREAPCEFSQQLYNTTFPPVHLPPKLTPSPHFLLPMYVFVAL